MPRLPDATALGARPSLTPAAPIRTADSGAVARAGQQFGRSLVRTAAVLQDQEDEAALNAARARLNEWEAENVFNPQTGAAAKRGRDAFGLSQQVTEGLQQFGSTLTPTLSTPRQQRLFNEMLQSRAAQLGQWASGRELGERERYYENEFQSSLQSSQQRIATVAGDPTLVATELEMQRRMIVGHYAKQGRSEAEVAEAVRTSASASHAVTLSTLLDAGDVATASAYFARNRNQMDAPQILTAQRAIRDATDAVAVTAEINALISAAGPQVRVGDFDRLANLAEAAESGGRQFGTDGKPLTSRAGAIGVMQVMPDTAPEAAKLAGLEWDEQKYKTDRTYNRAIGRAYLDEMLRRFDGDPRAALAAYNAGPTKVEATIRETEKYNAEFPEDARDWLDQLPAETQNYVAKITADFEAGRGAGKRPTLADMDAALVERHGANPRRLEMARTELRSKWAAYEAARKAEDDQLVADAYRALDANGGSYSALPASLRMRLPGDNIPALQSYARTRAAGEEPSTNWSVYYRLTTDPVLLRNTNVEALRGSLSNTEFKELTQRKLALESGAEAAGDIQGRKAIVDTMLAAADIDPNPKRGDEKAEARLGEFWSQLRARGVNDKTPPAEVERETRKLLTDVALDRKLWFGTSTVPAFEVQPQDIRRVRVPADERARISQALSENGIEATEEAIRAAYLVYGVGLPREALGAPEE